jgi:hypothetical protein
MKLTKEQEKKILDELERQKKQKIPVYKHSQKG